MQPGLLAVHLPLWALRLSTLCPEAVIRTTEDINTFILWFFINAYEITVFVAPLCHKTLARVFPLGFHPVLSHYHSPQLLRHCCKEYPHSLEVILSLLCLELLAKQLAITVYEPWIIPQGSVCLRTSPRWLWTWCQSRCQRPWTRQDMSVSSLEACSSSIIS